MNAGVVRQFGMERGSHDPSLPHGYRVFSFGGDDFDALAYSFNFRRANEHHLDRRVGSLPFPRFAFQELALPDRAVDLPPVGVAANADIDGAESRLLR